MSSPTQYRPPAQAPQTPQAPQSPNFWSAPTPPPSSTNPNIKWYAGIALGLAALLAIMILLLASAGGSTPSGGSSGSSGSSDSSGSSFSWMSTSQIETQMVAFDNWHVGNVSSGSPFRVTSAQCAVLTTTELARIFNCQVTTDPPGTASMTVTTDMAGRWYATVD